MILLQRFKLISAGAFALIGTVAWALDTAAKPETPILGRDAYRTSLDEVIVTGRSPYWQQKKPRWETPKVTVPEQATPSRLQLLPPYSRDERDEYNGVRDVQNPQPRIKLFEMKF